MTALSKICRRSAWIGLAALAAPTLLLASPPALAQSKETEAAGFEEALRAKFAAGDVLDWRGGNVRLRRPIVIESGL